MKKSETTDEVPVAKEPLKTAPVETTTAVAQMEDESPKPKRLKQNDENSPTEPTSEEEEEEEEIITHKGKSVDTIQDESSS